MKAVHVISIVLALAASVTLDPESYVEPIDAVYWQNGDVHRLAVEDMSQERFDKSILDGQVFIVEDVGRDWPMSKWDCDFFRSDPTFSKAEMTAQYTSAGSGFVGFKSDWLEKPTQSGAKDKDAPQVAPFYWGIKDVQYEDAHRSRTWKSSMLKRVQEHIRLPSFMNKLNQRNFETTPEFWFAGGGAGAKAHMDTHVQATISLQLAGTKRWRLKPLDARKTPFLAMTYRDGDPYEEEVAWAPLFNLTLRPGEALFFPPGFIHETLNLDNEVGSCSASVTFQFTHPMASRFYRRFFPRVRRTADIHEAWPLIEEWASLHSAAPRGGLPYEKAKEQAMSEKGVGGTFARLDKNSDGSLSRAELDASFRGEADSLLGFHDLDENGEITRAEFAEVFAFWAATVKSVVSKTPKKWRKYQLEDMQGDFNIEDLPRKLTEEMLKASRQSELQTAPTPRSPGGGEL